MNESIRILIILLGKAYSLMKNLYIIGAGGFGREIAWLVERINANNPTWNLKGFIDDDELLLGKYKNGYQVLGDCEYLKKLGEVYAVCAIASARIRKNIIDKFRGSKIIFTSLIDPSVLTSERVEIGSGAIICAGTILTVNIKIGNYAIVDVNSTRGQDSEIEDFVTLYPSVNISGNCIVGECSELGTGMQIIQGKKISRDCIIGAGAVVVKDITESGTFVGCPARKIK